MIVLRYLGHNRATYTGQETRKRYAWSGHGAELAVLTVDVAPLLMLRRMEGACCGAPKHDAGPLFEEIGDYTADDTITEENLI